MVNPEKVAADALARAKSNGSTMDKFFKPKEKPAEPPARGRPPKAPETRGRRPASALAAPAVTASPAITTTLPAATAPPTAVASAKSAPMKRTNWASGTNAAKLAQAVKEWNEKSGRAAEQEFIGEADMRKPSIREFCTMVDIPVGTFSKYVTPTDDKRQALGTHAGKPAHLSADESQFVADNIRRADRSNDGLKRRQILDIVQEIVPSLSRGQSAQALRAVRHTHKALTGIVKAQATTTKRTAITVTQQYRWHMMIESCYAELRQHNTGLCKHSGKTFGEVIEHFIWGGDETCLLASAGDVHIIGDKDKKKHEVKAGDSRMSIAMYRIGSVAGETGPTAFLMSGQRRRENYTNEFLERHGGAVGSSVHMTPTGFMTEKAWEELTPHQIRGIKAMPYIKANPQWKCIEILDGFGAHFSSPTAMQMKADANIICVKEEGDSSHVNQGYDQFVAKKDKQTVRWALDTVRQQSSICQGVLDQWQLVHVGLAAVRSVAPEIWIESFKAVNLNPRYRLEFPDWCKKISTDLEAGQQFKLETSVDIYSILPPVWLAMEPAEKKKVSSVIDAFDGCFPVECVQKLKSECSIAVKDMQNIRVCYETAKKHPDHLDMGVNQHSDAAGSSSAAPEVAAALAGQKPVSHGLINFELKPSGMAGRELLAHMSTFARRHTAEGTTLEPSRYLDIEITRDQRMILNPSQQDLTFRAIMRDTAGEGALKKLAKRKLDNVGDIKAHCGIQNSVERIRQLKAARELSDSLTEIARKDHESVTAKKAKASGDLLDEAPAAAGKLKSKQGNANKLTKLEIVAIALKYFAVQLKVSQPKPDLVTALEKAIAAKPTALGDVAPLAGNENENSAGGGRRGRSGGRAGGRGPGRGGCRGNGKSISSYFEKRARVQKEPDDEDEDEEDDEEDDEDEAEDEAEVDCENDPLGPDLVRVTEPLPCTAIHSEFVAFVPSQIIGRVFTGVGEVAANGEVGAHEICGVIGGVVYFQAAGYDQPDEDEIADLESIELKELRSHFENGAFFWK